MEGGRNGMKWYGLGFKYIKYSLSMSVVRQNSKNNKRIKECELMYKCIEKRMNEWLNEWMNEWIKEWMKEWINEWMDGWMNEWMNELINAWINE